MLLIVTGAAAVQATTATPNPLRTTAERKPHGRRPHPAAAFVHHHNHWPCWQAHMSWRGGRWEHWQNSPPRGEPPARRDAASKDALFRVTLSMDTLLRELTGDSRKLTDTSSTSSTLSTIVCPAFRRNRQADLKVLVCTLFADAAGI